MTSRLLGDENENVGPNKKKISAKVALKVDLAPGTCIPPASILAPPPFGKLFLQMQHHHWKEKVMQYLPEQAAFDFINIGISIDVEKHKTALNF